MSIIEIQFRDDVLSAIVAANLTRQKIPSSFLTTMGPGRMIERLEVGTVSLADPNDPLIREGEVLFQVPVQVHHSSFADAQAAGSLNPPATQQIPCIFWIKLAPVGPSALKPMLARAIVAGQQQPIVVPASLNPAKDPDAISVADVGLPVLDLELATGDGVVAIRMKTAPEDDLRTPVVNRLAGADWGQFVPGTIFADKLAASLNNAAADAVITSTNPLLGVTSWAGGLWMNGIPLLPGLFNLPSPWGAVAELEIEAIASIGPLPVYDVPLRILASTQIVADLVFKTLTLQTTIRWFAHDLITQLSGAAISVVENQVSKVILDTLKAPTSQVEVARGDNFVVFGSAMDSVELSNAVFTASVDDLVTDETGLAVTGSVKIMPPPVAVFTLDPQRWGSGPDCTARNWKTKYVPATVHIFCPDRGVGITLRSPPIVVPAGAWRPSLGTTGVGTGTSTRDIRFDQPFPPNPADLATSAFLDTNLGVRWVDLGVVPAEPQAQADPILLRAQVISDCMALTDRWGMGIMNLGWLVDPPDGDFGREAIREWTIHAAGIVEAERIEVSAIGAKGERRIAPMAVRDGTLFAQIITRQDETLQITSRLSLRSTPPVVMQRWITPLAVLSIEPDTVPLGFADGMLWVAIAGMPARIPVPSITLPGGRAIRADAAAQRATPGQTPPAMIARLRRSVSEPAGTRTAGREGLVAVMQDGKLVLGLAGLPRNVSTEERLIG